MKIIRHIKAPLIILILLIFNCAVNSQVVVERSKDKVIISGVQYYLHLVKKGETAYSISKAYGITVEELTRENPPAVYGVKEGQALRIPVTSVSEQMPSVPVPEKLPRDENKYIYHYLQPGETIYFLSKTFGVSENEIIQSNPGIDINKLSVGMEIAVPKRKFMSERKRFDEQQKKYIYHKVLKGESISSIAEQYGLTTRELRRENRDLWFPQVGDSVKVPVIGTTEVIKTEPVKADTAKIVIPEPVIKMVRPAGFTSVKNLSGTLNVAVLLPFYLNENSRRTEIDSSLSTKGRKMLKDFRRPEEWIYPGSVDFIEMYEGILLAADTLRSLGLNINIYSYDIKSDTIELTKLIRSGKLSRMDLIIGPVYSYNLSIVGAYARNLGIPVVSPVPLINNSALSDNPTLFMASSSLEIAQKKLAKKISEDPDCNFVFIHSDSLGIDKDVKRFKSLIFSELSYKLPYDDIRFKEFLFYSRSMFGNDSINRLSHALSEQSKNIVIIASEDAPVISETIMDIHGLSRKFNVTVYGYPVMRDIENLDPKYLFDLDIMIYSPYWIDYSKSNVKRFNARFREKFLTEPVEKSYSWQGYDIAYYFISGLATQGKNFIKNPEKHYPELLQTDFDFVRNAPGNGFENQKLIPLRYTKDYEVKLVEENNSDQ